MSVLVQIVFPLFPHQCGSNSRIINMLYVFVGIPLSFILLQFWRFFQQFWHLDVKDMGTKRSIMSGSRTYNCWKIWKFGEFLESGESKLICYRSRSETKYLWFNIRKFNFLSWEVLIWWIKRWVFSHENMGSDDDSHRRHHISSREQELIIN